MIRSWDGFLYHKSAPGEVIRAEEWNLFKAWLRRVRVRSGPGVSLKETPDGTVISCPAEPGWCFAYTPSGGIGARVGSPPSALTPGAADCQIYEWTGTSLEILDPDRRVHNPWRNAVAGSSLTRVVFRWGQWWVVNEDCPES